MRASKMLTIVVLLACIAQATSRVTFQICEWSRPDSRTLQCASNQKINIISALYGRRSTRICSSGYHRGVANCGRIASFNKAKQLCNGKRSCSLRASNSMFGDPCWGINKYLDVTYECKSVTPPIPRTFVGKWQLAYSNGHSDEYTISANGMIHLKSSNRNKPIEVSDNQNLFPSRDGWFKVNKLYRDRAWEYIRVKDGRIEIHHFCTDGCPKTYKSLRNYCCVGIGTRPVTASSNVALKDLVGKWELAYSNGHSDEYTISSNGMVHLKSSNRRQHIENSDDQKLFPSRDGWFKINRLYRVQAWEYIRLKDGRLEIHHFCIDGCPKTYKNLKDYCCVGIGTKPVARVSNVSLKDFVGKWKLSYSNKHHDEYTITADGMVHLKSSNRKQHIEVSDDQKLFPSRDGWFKINRLYRVQAWEYIRLKDGRLEIHHFCIDGCPQTYKSLKDYCCVGTGIKEDGANRFSLQICEWARPDSKTLTCSQKNQEIHIISAVYGRKSISICPHGYHKGVTNCGSTSSLKKVKELCDQKKSCTLRASNSMFGDPCWGINKYLDVVYECKTEGMTTYNIGLKTGRRRYAGTDASVYMYLVGEKGQTGKIIFKTSKTYNNKFESNQLDQFEEEEIDVGKITKIIIGHDNTRKGPGWYLDYATVNLKGSSCKMTFPGYRWVQKGSLEATLYPMYDAVTCNLGKTKKYNIEVKTSNKGYAGTDAHVVIMLQGKKADTGFIRLTKSHTHSKPFLRNNLDKFTVEAPDVGDEITMIRIGHDNTGSGPGWHLDHVTVAAAGATCKSSYYAGQWIKYGNLEVELFPTFSDSVCGKALATYEIDIKTGSRKYSGTDSNVFIIIYGENGDTGKLLLKHSKTKGDIFERHHTDSFVGKAADVGAIKRITIGHDNKGKEPGWFLDTIVIKAKTCTWEFSGWQWLTKKKLSMDMYPTLEQGKCRETASHGGICDRDFRKIGCFKRDWEKVPDLLITDLDPTHKNYTTDMNWDDFTLGLHSLACRCRAKAVGHYKYFGMGFHAECVAGKDTASLEKMFKEAKDNPESEGCINGRLGTCDKNDKDSECAGAADYDFFYEIVE